jgi:hypothetical protein
MGIIIRTAFNNQEWAGPCKNPLSDPRCYQCTEGRVNVNWWRPIEVDENGFCKGDIQDGELWCWEQTLCTKYFWGNAIGKWGPRAYSGEKVYLVYRERDGSYTLWGRTKVDRIDNEAKAYPNYLEPFKPLPKDKWVRGLSDIDLTGKLWLRPNFRYIDNKREAFLDSLIEGGSPEQKFKEQPRISPPSQADYMTINLRLKRNVMERLEKFAHSEGREVEEITREAIAEWLKGREF